MSNCKQYLAHLIPSRSTGAVHTYLELFARYFIVKSDKPFHVEPLLSTDIFVRNHFFLAGNPTKTSNFRLITEPDT
jgi:hypothetical protein